MSWASQSHKLLDNASATGSAFTVLGGRYIWDAVATWSGATAQLQSLGPDGSTWVDITDASLTDDGAIGVFIANGSKIRVLITGSPSAVYSSLVSVRE